jgi:hypothetical protein
MNEARYSVTIKINGDLFTVRGDTAEEFAENVSKAHSVIDAVKGLQANSGTPVAQPTAAPVTKPAPVGQQALVNAFGDMDLYNVQVSSGHTCPHGARVYKSGTNKAGKPYKGWYCPQLSPDCKVEWVK